MLETTAGQGTGIGYCFEHLRDIISQVTKNDFMGVCFDTCHVFTAGYDITTKSGYENTMRELGRIVGIERIKVFHLNDSKKPLGSRRDRHEHIGKGLIGLEPFRFILKDCRFKKIPMVIETPAFNGMKENRMNLNTLRQLGSSEIS